jgi:methyl-accepting chemotaxis protein
MDNTEDLTDGSFLSSDHETSQERSSENDARSTALSKIQLVVEYSCEGKILEVNDLFCTVMGFSFGESIGMEHVKTVTVKYSRSESYKKFWEALRKGEHKPSESKRIGKDGKEVWLNSLFVPICQDDDHIPFKIIEYATDVTEKKIAQNNYEAQIAVRNNFGCLSVF